MSARELVKKAASVALWVGALALLLVNAALTHGCAGSRAGASTANAGTGTQLGGTEPGTPSESEGTSSSGAKDGNKADDPCTPPAYMYATKAPVWIPPECRAGEYGKSAPNPPPQQAPPNVQRRPEQQQPAAQVP